MRLPLLAVFFLASQAASAGTCLDITVPAYFYPFPTGSSWDMALASRPPPAGMIVNPASGPGTSVDPNYRKVIHEAQFSYPYVTILGYVDTDYGKRSISQVESDVAAWVKFYRPNAIFFDRVMATSSFYSYYETLSNYVAVNVGRVFLNPGVYPGDERFMQLNSGTVKVVTCENTYAACAAVTPPSWASKYSNQIYIMHNTVSSDRQNAANLAASRNVKGVYITDQPYNALPSYWQLEVSYTKDGC